MKTKKGKAHENGYKHYLIILQASDEYKSGAAFDVKRATEIWDIQHETANKVLREMTQNRLLTRVRMANTSYLYRKASDNLMKDPFPGISNRGPRIGLHQPPQLCPTAAEMRAMRESL